MLFGKGTRGVLNEYREKKLAESIELKNIHCTTITRKDFPDPRKEGAFKTALKISMADSLLSALVLAVLYYIFDHYFSAAGSTVIYAILFMIFLAVFLGYDLIKYKKHCSSVREYLDRENRK